MIFLKQYIDRLTPDGRSCSDCHSLWIIQVSGSKVKWIVVDDRLSRLNE